MPPQPLQAPPAPKRRRNPFAREPEAPHEATSFLDSLMPLTRQEADAKRDKLIKGFILFWKCTDDFMSATNKAKAEAFIWQTMDEELTGEIVDQLLNAGMQNKIVAETTRRLADTFDQFKIGMIIGPRFVDSWRFYMKNGVGM